MKLFNIGSSKLPGEARDKAVLKNLNGNHVQKVIILFGPPGSGKGTQSELLAKKFYFYNLDTSRVLEEKFKNAKLGEQVQIGGKSYPLADEIEKRRRGVLCSVEFTACLMNKRIAEIHSLGKSLILSGSPRSMEEAAIEMPFLEEIYGKDNINIFFLDLPPEQTVFRNSNRRVCELMRHSILFIPENANLKRCPLDGSRLVHRDLDNVETIKTRLAEYEETATSLEDYYRRNNFQIKRVDANQYVEDVFQNILEALGPSFKVYEI